MLNSVVKHGKRWDCQFVMNSSHTMDVTALLFCSVDPDARMVWYTPAEAWPTAEAVLARFGRERSRSASLRQIVWYALAEASAEALRPKRVEQLLNPTLGPRRRGLGTRQRARRSLRAGGSRGKGNRPPGTAEAAAAGRRPAAGDRPAVGQCGSRALAG